MIFRRMANSVVVCILLQYETLTVVYELLPYRSPKTSKVLDINIIQLVPGIFDARMYDKHDNMPTLASHRMYPHIDNYRTLCLPSSSSSLNSMTYLVTTTLTLILDYYTLHSQIFPPTTLHIFPNVGGCFEVQWRLNSLNMI